MIFKKTDNFLVSDVPLKGLYWWIPGGKGWSELGVMEEERVMLFADKMQREGERCGF